MMPNCRYCHAPLTQTLVNLGSTPLANSYLPMQDPDALKNEQCFPLWVMVCDQCWLAQTTENTPADAIFDHDYAYLSSYSAGWVEHAGNYAREMKKRYTLDAQSLVVEIASNDGYLLRHFVEMGVPVLGIEPAGHAAEVARAAGVETKVAFFGRQLASEMRAEGICADLMAANNVLAHVPDIADFIAGFAILLAPDGVATFEFPHLANLLEKVQFDTIYHEHYSYLSLLFVERLMRDAGLEVFDVAQLPTHGGSLRVFVGHPGKHAPGTMLNEVRTREADLRMDQIEGYAGFSQQVGKIVDGLREFLHNAKTEGKSVAAYGAAAKGNTFLNVAGITHMDISFVVDLNPQKQEKLLPGSHIPVYSPEVIAVEKPDYLVILPWNIAPEVMAQQSGIRDWGGRFVVAIPELTIL
jgi:2-polyprenyl-3-methyl-5-hydroxy-6-metoxy-1,4-benzoquinol methylase